MGIIEKYSYKGLIMNIKKYVFILIGLSLLFFTACGGGGSSSSSSSNNQQMSVGIFNDVSGVQYKTSSGLTGYTDSNGQFQYNNGDTITFNVDKVILGTLEAQSDINVGSFSNPAMVAQTLQALDEDANPDNGIAITSPTTNNTSMQRVSVLNAASSADTTQIDLDQISSYNEDYINFIKNNGLDIQDKYTALAAEILRQISIPKIKQENYIGKIMTGHMKAPPFSRYGSDKTMMQYITNNIENKNPDSAYAYRVRGVTLYQMMLNTIKAQEKASKKIVADSKKTRDEGQLLVKDTMQSVHASMGVADNLLNKKGVKELAKILAEHTTDTSIDHLLPDDVQDEAKLAMLYITKCSSAKKLKKNISDCVQKTAEYQTKKFIDSKLDEQHAVIAKGAVDLASNLINTLEKCNAVDFKENPMDCFGAVTDATAGKLFEAAMTTRDIYLLDSNLTKQNSQIIGTEIFYTTMYRQNDDLVFNKNNSLERYCQLYDLYSFDSNKCYAGNENDSFNFFVKAVIEKMKENAANPLTTTFLFENVNYDAQEVLHQIDQLTEEYNSMYATNNAKLLKYKNLDQATKRWRYNQVAISEPNNVTILNTQDGKKQLHACFNIHPKMPLIDLKPSMELVTKDGKTQQSFSLDNYDTIVNANRKKQFCGNVVLDDSLKDDTLLIKNTLSFVFSKYPNKTEILKNFTLYNIHFPKIPQKEVQLDISGEYTKLSSYYFKSNLYTGENDPNYTYIWKLQTDDFDDACTLSKESNQGYLYYGAVSGIGSGGKDIPRKCLQKTMNITLTVIHNQESLGTVSKTFSPLVLFDEQQPLTIDIDKTTIALSAGESKEFTVTLDGGDVTNYTLDVLSDNPQFNVIKENNNKYSVTSIGSTENNTYGTITITASDGQTTVEKTLQVAQAALKTDKPLIVTYFAEKKPYSKYIYQGYLYNKYAQVTPEKTFTQTWKIQNVSSHTLYNVTMKMSPYCSTKLIHDKGDIFIGDLAPNDVATPSLEIDGGGENGDINYCQWDLYAQDDQGKSVRLLWNKSQKAASLNYYIKTVQLKDTASPYIGNGSFLYKNGQIKGSFTIKQKNHLIKHLRVSIKPYAGYDSNIENIDIGDYETIQADGSKSFTFTLPSNWPNYSAYISISAQNKDGVAMQQYTQGLHLIGYVPYKVINLQLISVQPSTAQKGSTFSFTAHLSRKLQKGEAVYLNFNVPNSSSWLNQSDPGGHVAMSCDGTTCRASTVINGIGARSVRAGLFVGDNLRYNYSTPQSFTVTEQSNIDQKYKILAGKTFYTKSGESWIFSNDLQSLQAGSRNYQLSTSTNGLKIAGTSTKYLVVQSQSSQYVVVQFLDITEGGVILGRGDKYTLYFNSPNQNISDLRSLLGGKTLYAVGYGSDGFHAAGSAEFDKDLTTLHYKGIWNDPNDDETDSIKVEGNKLIWLSDNSYSIVGANKGDYIEVTDYNADSSLDGTIPTRLYFDKAKAEAYFNSLKSGSSASGQDLKSLIVGKTYYTVAYDSYTDVNGQVVNNDHIEILNFENDGQTMVDTWTVNGKQEKSTFTYSISNGKLKITGADYDGNLVNFNSSPVINTSNFIKFNDGLILYKTKQVAEDALNDGGSTSSSNSTPITGLVSGHVKFLDDNQNMVAVPSNAWIRITPSRYQIEGNWNGVNCKLDSSGNFGNTCYIHMNESDMRNAFQDQSETFQIAVYAESTGDTHWEAEEKSYGGSENVQYGSWSNFEIGGG